MKKNLLLIISPLVLLLLIGAAGPSTVTVNSTTFALAYPTAARFYAANPIPLSALPSPIWGGTATTETFLAGGNVEWFQNSPAEVSIQPQGNKHGLIVHTTGSQGMAIIGVSETGSPALKGFQKGLYDFPDVVAYRSSSPQTAPTDAPLFYGFASGAADLLKLENPSGSFRVDGAGALHLQSFPDANAPPSSVYISETTNTPTFKNSAGISASMVSSGNTSSSGGGLVSVASDSAKLALTGLSAGQMVQVTGEGNRIELFIGGAASTQANWMVIRNSVRLMVLTSGSASFAVNGVQVSGSSGTRLGWVDPGNVVITNLLESNAYVKSLYYTYPGMTGAVYLMNGLTPSSSGAILSFPNTNSATVAIPPVPPRQAYVLMDIEFN